MRVALRRILSENGYDVIGEAQNGIEAVSLYQSLRPDLVTMDIAMPEMDGIAALKAIREFDPNAIVVMCSAIGKRNMIHEALLAGAADFLVKPFHSGRVLETFGKIAA